MNLTHRNGAIAGTYLLTLKTDYPFLGRLKAFHDAKDIFFFNRLARRDEVDGRAPRRESCRARLPDDNTYKTLSTGSCRGRISRSPNFELVCTPWSSRWKFGTQLNFERL
jgi:hypothetical protein